MTQDRSLTRALPAQALRLAAIGLVYALVLRFTPGFPSPFLQDQPLAVAAGVALAAAALWGPSVMAALGMGAWAAHGFGGDATILVALAAAVMHGGIGALLMHRSSRQDLLALESARDIVLRFVLPALAASLGGALAAVGVAALSQPQPGSIIAASALARLGADLTGMLIVAPIVFAFFGQPAANWRSRRLGVAVPMVATVALLLGAIAAISRWDEQRARADFAVIAKELFVRVDTSLHRALDVVNVMHGATLAAGRPLERAQFELVAVPWLQGAPIVNGVAWHERVARADVQRYVDRVRGEGEAGFRIHQQPGGVPQATLDGDTDLVVTRQMLSLAGKPGQRDAAIGLNVLSVPEVRDTLKRALHGGPERASPPFRITTAQDQGIGVVLFRPLRLTQGPVSGLVATAVYVERALTEAIGTLPLGAEVCIVDISVARGQGRLAGAPGCELREPDSAALLHEQSLEFAGRTWQLRVNQPLASAIQISGGFWGVWWLFAWPGLLGASLLSGLLLVNTGRVRRIESEVDRRTAELTRESQERRQAEQTAAHALRELRGIFDTVTVGVVQLEPDGRFRNANPAFCNLTGYSLEELRSMNVAEITPPQDHHVYRAVAAMMARNDPGVVRGNKHYRRKDGRLVPVAVTVRAVLDASGKAMYAVGAVQDMSETIRLLEAERARDQAEASNRAKSQFVARMSHELRTPLNAVLGFAQLLDTQAARLLPPTQRGWLARLLQAGWHLLAMINDVLDLSRIESDSLDMNVALIDLREVIETAVSMVDEAARARGITVRRDLARDTLAVMGDPLRLRQVLINLLSNAVKYNREGGQIEVRCQRGTAGTVLIEVADTGMGMASEQLSTLFQPFNRLGRERSAVEGTGIGLTIAKRLTELMGGQLRVRSTADVGSVFTLELTAAEPAALAAAADERAQDSDSRYSTRRVLYVEDNETNVEIMRAMLSQRGQIDLSVAANGAEGLAAARRLQPDLILLDLDLPDIDGVEVLQLLRADLRLSRTPVIVVSAHAQADQVGATFEAGASDFVAKPVDLQTLLTAIDKHLLATHSVF